MEVGKGMAEELSVEKIPLKLIDLPHTIVDILPNHQLMLSYAKDDEFKYPMQLD